MLDKQKAEERKNQVSVTPTQSKRDSIFSKFRGSTKQLERRQSQMSLHFKQRMTTPRMGGGHQSSGQIMKSADAGNMFQSASAVGLTRQSTELDNIN